jgi:hypothetical protein
MNKSKTYKSNLEDAVMAKIKSGNVKMRPHYYYVLMAVLGISFVALIGFVISYFMSVVTLWLRIQAATGPAYGARRNFSLLVGNFPWWALILGLVALAVAVMIVRRISSLYKLRLAYLVSIVISAAILLGVAFSYSSLPNTIKSHRPQAVGQNQSNGYRHGQQTK